MTNISKILAVFVTVASLAFMGVVFVGSAGGMNFESEVQDETLNSIAWDKKLDEVSGKMQWSAQTRLKRGDPKNPAAGFKEQDIGKDITNLPQLLVNAHKFVQTDQRQQLEQLESRIKARNDQLKLAKATIGVDLKAMQKRLADLQAVLKKRRDLRATQQARVAKLQLAAISDREKAVRRRDDVERIRNQVDEINGEIYQLEKQREKLLVYIDAIQGAIERLQNRAKGLKNPM